MKKKFITKLILGGVALAASTATLVSTTYAWYVQNTQVTATNISGAVKDNNASSIFISKNYVLATPNSATWLQSVEFVKPVNEQMNDYVIAFTGDTLDDTITGKGVNKVYNGGLDPITLTATNGYFVDVNGQTSEFTVVDSPVEGNKASYFEVVDGNFVSSANITFNSNKKYYTHNAGFVYDAAASRVIEFSLYVQANVDGTKIRPYIILDNTTTAATAKSQTAYKPVALTNGDTVDQGTQFWIDAVQALRMQVEVSTPKSDKTGWDLTTEDLEHDILTSNGIYDVLGIAKKSYDSSNNSYAPYTPIEIKSYKLTSDETPVSGKTYYERTGSQEPYTYTAVTSAIDNPKTSGYYENITVTEEQLAFGNVTIGDEQVSLKGANKYYYDLTGRVPTGTFNERAQLVKTTGETPVPVSNINKTTLSKDTVYKFTFRIWLEGTDPACFDSCVKQTFDIRVNFDVEN